MQAWHAGLDSVATVYRATAALLARVRAADASMKTRADTVGELQTRLGALYQALESQVGPPTADMRKQLASYSALYARMERTVSGR
jgi:nitrate/nitrite-specific signal transduction histidine kinase